MIPSQKEAGRHVFQAWWESVEHILYNFPQPFGLQFEKGGFWLSLVSQLQIWIQLQQDDKMFKRFNHSRIFFLYTHVYIQSVKQRKKTRFKKRTNFTTFGMVLSNLCWDVKERIAHTKNDCHVDWRWDDADDVGYGWEIWSSEKIFEPNKGGMEQPPWQRTQMHQLLASEFLMKKKMLYLRHLDLENHGFYWTNETLPRLSCDFLVGGWTNPSEKYARQIGWSPQFSGWKFQK